MILTIAVTLCHLAAAQGHSTSGDPQDNGDLGPDPTRTVKTEDLNLCHEEIIFQGEGSMQMCTLPMAAVADWKNKSRYASPDWTIGRVLCKPGRYNPKDVI